jgi:hypothetical protein
MTLDKTQVKGGQEIEPDSATMNHQFQVIRVESFQLEGEIQTQI